MKWIKKLKMLPPRKIKIIVLVGLVLSIITVGVFLLVQSMERSVSIDTASYALKCDKSWKIDIKLNDNLKLTHQTGGVINMSIKDLGESDLYKSTKELSDELYFSIEKQNQDYSKISSKSSYISSNGIETIENMYESSKQNSMISIFKFNDKVVIFDYTADKSYFDILLNSVGHIKDSLLMKNKPVQISSKLDEIEATGIKYAEDGVSYEETLDYEIYSNKYHVKYKIPSQFKVSSYDSTTGYYNYIDGSKSIRINTTVTYSSAYDFIKNGYMNTEINLIKKTADYSDVTVENEAISIDDVSGYVYKISYKTGPPYQKTYQKFYVVYSLDDRNTFVVDIQSSDFEITKKLIDGIKLIGSEKYGYNIDKSLVNGTYSGTMIAKSSLADGSSGFSELKYRVPSKYTELDKGQNMYDTRYFGMQYDFKSDEYKYNVLMDFGLMCGHVSASECLERYVTNSNRKYYLLNDMSMEKMSDITIDGKTFEHYSSKNILKSSNESTFDDLIIYETENSGCYTVQIYSDNANINKDIISDFIQFEVSQK